MSVNQNTRNNLLSFDTPLFDCPAFDNSIIGKTFDGRAIYDFKKMVRELMRDNRITENEAIDWIEYNTLRTSQYMGVKAPIVINTEQTKTTELDCESYIFEIENSNGNPLLAFEITVNENCTIEITKTNNANLADIDGDYIFNSNHELYRIQEL